jgi:hypothetical protein
MNNAQIAAQQIGEAMKLLEKAKQNLSRIKSDSVMPLVLAIGQVRQVLEVVEDPDCTPEVAELIHEPFHDDGDHIDPYANPYVWDGERIEATKTILFHEALHNDQLY